MKTRIRLCAIAVAAALLAGPAWAQTAAGAAPPDPRWAPWLGCWQLADETISDPSSFADALAALQRSRANAGSLVCVTPAPGGATMTTLVNDQTVLTETLVADGLQKVVTEDGCRGWQRAEWSQLGTRVFARAEISCADQKPRTVSGLSMLSTGPNWVDIQVIESEGRKSLRVRRYQRARDQKHAGMLPSARDTSAMPLAAKLSIAEVKEASGKVAPEALQAALVELRSGFDLNGKRLIELDRAGVPASVIDLMVALSFPKRFVVDRAGRGGGGSGWGGGGVGSTAWGMDDLDMWPLFAHPYFYSSYYSPFGYRNWGYYDNYYFQGPGFVTVDPGGQVAPQPSGSGRVVDGLGYTRVRRSEPEPTIQRGNSGNGSNSGSAMDNSGSNSGSGSSGSGGVTSSGYSGGGAGSGDRTAVARPPGGM
jgi:hypothetical protein